MSQMNRREFLGCTAALALGAAARAAEAQDVLAGKRPNIVLIMTDDQGYGDLACHGNPIIKTPNIDRLHGESVRFTDFHVSPTCAPGASARFSSSTPTPRSTDSST